jgi:hypothetical protein
MREGPCQARSGERRSDSGWCQASCEREQVWLVAERAMRWTSASLPRQCDEVVGGVVLGGISDRLRGGHGGIGEELGFRVRDCPSGTHGVRRENGSSIGLTSTERPPRQSREHSGPTSGNVCVSVAVCRGVEQPFGPGQITQASSHCGLANDGVC